ncbi:MAG: glycerol-3-phosphate acyltransferase [Acidimicrobiia bacterium]
MGDGGRGWRLLGAGVVGYLAGTIPAADAAARLAGSGADLRRSGSGNPGAANAMEVLGRTWGYGVLVADIAKGASGCGLGRCLAGELGAHVAGTAAVVGHCFPVWSGFRGGKGVATSAGQCLATFPAYVPIDVAVMVGSGMVPRWKRRAFASTVIGCVAWVAAGGLWATKQWPNLWGPRPSPGLPLAAAASSAVIIYRFARTPARVDPAPADRGLDRYLPGRRRPGADGPPAGAATEAPR